MEFLLIISVVTIAVLCVIWHKSETSRKYLLTIIANLEKKESELTNMIANLKRKKSELTNIINDAIDIYIKNNNEDLSIQTAVNKLKEKKEKLNNLSVSNDFIQAKLDRYILRLSRYIFVADDIIELNRSICNCHMNGNYFVSYDKLSEIICEHGHILDELKKEIIKYPNIKNGNKDYCNKSKYSYAQSSSKTLTRSNFNQNIIKYDKDSRKKHRDYHQENIHFFENWD